MKEILFKGKRKDNGQWVYGFYWNRGEFSHYIKDIDDSGNLIGDYEVDHKTVCEYIGIADKNGTKIFENDIVKDSFGKNNEVIYGKHDIYCCGCCYQYHRAIGFYLSEYNEDEETFDDLEVVGNIYD